MDKDKEERDGKNANGISENGIYVRGVVVSSMARIGERRDDSGRYVNVRHEIALQPGIAVLDQYFDPERDSEVQVKGMDVVRYPKLPEFQTVLLKALWYDVRNDTLTVKRFEIV